MKKVLLNQRKRHRAKVRKIAISLPSETCEEIERIQDLYGLSRSGAIAYCVDRWRERRAEMEMEKKYLEGYRKKPESPAEVEPLYNAGLTSFTPEKW